MSLLPKYTDNFLEEVYKSTCIFDADPCVKPALEAYTKAMFDSQRALLDPAQNPLTFEEVKAWFDMMCEKGEVEYNGEYEYKNILYSHYIVSPPKLTGYFYISKDHYLRSLRSRCYQFQYINLFITDDFFHNLYEKELLGIPPLTLFGQMKGYFEI